MPEHTQRERVLDVLALYPEGRSAEDVAEAAHLGLVSARAILDTLVYQRLAEYDEHEGLYYRTADDETEGA